MRKPTSLRETPGDLLHLDGGVTDEGRSLVQLRDPAQPGLERGGGVVDVVAVQRVSDLEPQGIARAEADGMGSARPAEAVPDRRGVRARQ